MYVCIASICLYVCVCCAPMLATKRALNFVKSQGQWFLACFDFGQRCQLWLSLYCVFVQTDTHIHTHMHVRTYICMLCERYSGCVWLTGGSIVQDTHTGTCGGVVSVSIYPLPPPVCTSSVCFIACCALCLSHGRSVSSSLVCILRIMGSSVYVCVCVCVVCVRHRKQVENGTRYFDVLFHFQFKLLWSIRQRTQAAAACLPVRPCKRFMNPQWRGERRRTCPSRNTQTDTYTHACTYRKTQRDRCRSFKTMGKILNEILILKQIVEAGR